MFAKKRRLIWAACLLALTACHPPVLPPPPPEPGPVALLVKDATILVADALKTIAFI